MIERLGRLRGVWDEDTVQIIEKVNELVDLANSKEIGSKPQKKAPTATPKNASAKGAVLKRKDKIQTISKGKAAAERKDDQNYNL